MWKCALILLLINASSSWAKPQQQSDIDIQGVIDSVFSTSTRRPQRGGFNVVVTPEPIIGPTQVPQVLQTSQGRKCTCVPYYLCEAENMTIRSDGQYDGFGLIDIRFDAESCRDVLDLCCVDEKRQETPITPPSVTENPNRPTGCGIRNVNGVDFQITGNFNNEANFGEFPWTVALIDASGDNCLCVGSLIHPQVVLTGSHCVWKIQAGNIKVRAGEWDTQTTKERLPYQEQYASKYITHPDYSSRSLANDVALVILQKPFTLADHISTICLPPQNYDSTGSTCLASGWGKDLFGQAGQYSVIMKRVSLPIVPNDICEESLRKTRLGSLFNLNPSFICAGGVKGVDTCQGDGGAPLVCPIGVPSQNRFVQSGIVSWGIGCNEERPAVYANVASARNWIDAMMAEEGFSTASYTFQ